MNKLLCFWIGVASPCMANVDITFYAISDVHYGSHQPPRDSNRAQTVEVLNALPGRAYPVTAGGGTVAAPRGVLLAGDLVDEPDTGFWFQYIADYGVHGEGRMKFPVYDGLGNHDEPGISHIIFPLFLRRNAQRHDIANVDSLDYHYSWDWDGVHFVNLNLYSGTLQGNGVGNPLSSVDFLKRDLEQCVGISGRPVFVMQHYPFDSSEVWWNESEKQKTLDVLKNYNVIGILHGHTHSKKFYRWQGFDVFDDGAAMYGDMLVFHITDNRLLAQNLVNGQWGKLMKDKTISMGGAVAIRPMPASRFGRRYPVFGIPEWEWIRGRRNPIPRSGASRR